MWCMRQDTKYSNNDGSPPLTMPSLSSQEWRALFLQEVFSATPPAEEEMTVPEVPTTPGIFITQRDHENRASRASSFDQEPSLNIYNPPIFATTQTNNGSPATTDEPMSQKSFELSPPHLTTPKNIPTIPVPETTAPTADAWGNCEQPLTNSMQNRCLPKKIRTRYSR